MGCVPRKQQRRKARRMAIAYCCRCAANPAPPVGRGCHKPSKDCCQCPERHVHWWQGGGGGNGGGRIKRYNNDNDNISLNAVAGKVVDDIPAGQGYDGQQ